MTLNSAPSPDELRVALPGTWRILATTFPLWRNGKRLRPTITYTLIRADPLVLRDEVGYHTRAGTQRSIIGTDRYEPGTDRLVWRGRGLLGLLTSRWGVDRLSAAGELAVVTFDRSLLTPAGMDIIGRSDRDISDLRDYLTPDALGLTASQWDMLTWL
jgi:hypothetical protein